MAVERGDISGGLGLYFLIYWSGLPVKTARGNTNGVGATRLLAMQAWHKTRTPYLML